MFLQQRMERCFVESKMFETFDELHPKKIHRLKNYEIKIIFHDLMTKFIS